jgi:hypothetical protein
MYRWRVDRDNTITTKTSPREKTREKEVWQ